jgi:4a-hydroxytetrahydrobiopterin dehydratase
MISQAMIARMTPIPPSAGPVHTQEQLARMSCPAIKQHVAMPLHQVMAQVAELPPWHYQNGKLCLRIGFSDYAKTRAFISAVADIADREDHHPVIEFGYSHAVILFDTHDVAGISIKDFICAAKVSVLI